MPFLPLPLHPDPWGELTPHLPDIQAEAGEGAPLPWVGWAGCCAHRGQRVTHCPGPRQGAQGGRGACPVLAHGAALKAQARSGHAPRVGASAGPLLMMWNLRVGGSGSSLELRSPTRTQNTAGHLRTAPALHKPFPQLPRDWGDSGTISDFSPGRPWEPGVRPPPFGR